MGRLKAVHAAILSASILVFVGALDPEPASATTGPYTRPYFSADVYVTQGYGCTTYTGEPNFTTGYNADGIYYDCPAENPPQYDFHPAMDYGNFGTGRDRDVAAAAAGTVVDIHTTQTQSTCGTISTGNFVLLEHDGQYTLYYHLKYGSIVVAMNDEVSAGQKLGKAGDTGNACGVHLHYALMDCNCSNPDPEDTYKPNGKWTTSPGRVPWLATYYSESDSGTVDICYGATVTHWVKFKNTGGQTWKTTNPANGKGRIVLYSTNSSGTGAQSSQFKAADWESSSLVTPADQSSVAPDGIGTFTFGLKGNGVEGNYYDNYFNLKAYDLRYFDYQTIGQYYIPIFIVPHQGCL